MVELAASALRSSSGPPNNFHRNVLLDMIVLHSYVLLDKILRLRRMLEILLH